MALKAEAVIPGQECDCPRCQALADLMPEIVARLPALFALLREPEDRNVRLGLVSSIMMTTLVYEFPTNPLEALMDLQMTVAQGITAHRANMAALEENTPGPTTSDVGHG